jgi:hypothetical protein
VFFAVVDNQTAHSCSWPPFEKSNEQPEVTQN